MFKPGDKVVRFIPVECYGDDDVQLNSFYYLFVANVED